MKKCLLVLTMALVVATLLLGGCSSAAPAPAAKSASTEPAQASKPAAEPAKASAPAPAKEAAPAPASAPPAAKAPAKTYDWKFVSPMAPGHSRNASIKQFSKLLQERSNGAVKITIYEASLGSPADGWDMLKNNGTQFLITADAFSAGRMPIASMVGLPVEFPDSTSASLAAAEMLKAGYLKELTDNFKVLYLAASPQFHFFLRDKKVTKTDDLKGLKIRTAATVQAQLATALGATGVTMPSAEVYMGLDRKVIDGTITGPDNVVDLKLTEVTKYALKQPLTGGLFATMMNKETWDSLTPDLQKTIDQISQEVAAAEWKQVVADEEKNWQTVGKTSEIYPLGPEELAKWRAAAAGVTDKVVAETAAKGYPAKEALELIRKTVAGYKK